MKRMYEEDISQYVNGKIFQYLRKKIFLFLSRKISQYLSRKIFQHLSRKISYPGLVIVGSGKTAEESCSEAGVCCRVWLDSIVINIVINIIFGWTALLLTLFLAGQHCY